MIAAWRKSRPGQALRKACRYVGSLQSVRLDPNRPANTQIKAHLHWHYAEPRQLTILEAQILQGFPERYRFAGTKGNAKERIGNSVPPILMKRIAENIRKAPFMQKVKEPTVISTFAGCGGSSLGYRMAGFRELLAVEWDANAVETFRLNFPGIPVYHGDIGKLSVEECMRLAGLSGPGELDVLDGSPPCQGFSTAGKRNLMDSRNSLFREYVRLLRGLRPKVFVMENVTGLVKGYMKTVYLEMVRELRAAGYIVKGQVMNAMYYGVPQSRQRVIVIGVREDLGVEPSHPKPASKPMPLKDVIPSFDKQASKQASKQARSLAVTAVR